MVGCEVCGSPHDLLRCAECQSCICQSHQLSHWQALHCQQSAASSASSGWDAETVGSSAAAAPDFPHPRSPFQEHEADRRRRHEPEEPDQGPYVHAWPVEAELDGGYENARRYEAQQQQQQPYLRRSGFGLVPRPPEMPVAPKDSLWMRAMCHYVIRDMDKYGICVIDNFAGQAVGSAVLDEVVAMYAGGRFMDGEVMSASGGNAAKTIRGDKIVWVDGNEPACKHVGNLIRLVDTVVINSNRIRGNGKLGEYNITDRSRAMVACYPGGGTQYVKHVDNPNKDGRCITCIYYLNKDWDVKVAFDLKRDGGLLRIFPQGWTASVADIEPTFDRILLFWSDRRNPHEVQPALRTRYAITLWYYDKAEAEAARRHLVEREAAAQQVHASNAASPF